MFRRVVLGRRPSVCRASVLGAALALALICVFVAPVARATDDVARMGALPPAVQDALRATGLPLSAFAVVIRPLGAKGVRVRLNETASMSPASTMKLVTTYAALELLGPAYRWRTEALAGGPLRGDTLEGDLLFRGSGDPKLMVENLWLLVQNIRAYGVREIRGDVVLDRSAFPTDPHDAAAFDGEPLRPYNTGPDALLLNYKSLSVGFVPDAASRTARVVVLPPLAGLDWPAFVPVSDGPCNDWRAQLKADFADPLQPVFRGSFPLACGERVWHVSLLDHVGYFDAVFRALWQAAGGVWSGQVRDGVVPDGARAIAVQQSPPLSLVIRDINKFSNNVMARQLFLSLGADPSRPPATAARSSIVVRDWLRRRGIDMPTLVLENGSGLSRIERASAGGLANLLVAAYESPLMPEFMSSLPLVNVDGTERRRTAAAGQAHVKSGLLADVRAQAGFVLTASGTRYVLVAVANHTQADRAQPFLDFLLDWLYRNG